MIVLYGSPDSDSTMAALSWLHENGLEQIDCRDVTIPPYNTKTWLLPTLEGNHGILEGFSPEAYKTFFNV